MGNRKSSYYAPSVAVDERRTASVPRAKLAEKLDDECSAYKTGGKLERNRYGSFGGDFMSVGVPFDECDFKTGK